MNENINLCELLEGHEGETFYSSFMGDVTFLHIQKIGNPIVLDRGYTLSSDGKVNTNGECMLFPSKDQRDWNKWAEEQKPKVPKTWSELIDDKKSILLATETCSLIEKSASALLKIHQLIEVGYGGNITNEEWDDDILKYVILRKNKIIEPDILYKMYIPIAFHTQQQRDEFLSYPENVQLVKDFYMIP